MKLLKFSLKMYGLDELAETCDDIEISITLYGTKLTSNLFHVTAGLKIVDVRAKEPETGKLLMAFGNLQSRDNSIVMELHLMKDSKDGYKYFKPFFQFFAAVEKNGLTADKHGKCIKTLIISSPQDLKSHWISLCKGGAAKRDRNPYHCYDITSNELAQAKILTEICDKCKETNKEQCYHWNVVNSEYLNVSYY